MGSPWVAFPLAFTLIKLKDSGDSVFRVLGLWVGVALAVLVASHVEVLRRTLQERYLRVGAAACGVLLVICVSLTVFLNAPPPLPSPRAAPASATGHPNVLLIVLDTVAPIISRFMGMDAAPRRTWSGWRRKECSFVTLSPPPISR